MSWLKLLSQARVPNATVDLERSRSFRSLSINKKPAPVGFFFAAISVAAIHELPLPLPTSPSDIIEM